LGRIDSWTDKSLIETGGFYTPEVKTPGRPRSGLRFYAECFPVVEVEQLRAADGQERPPLVGAHAVGRENMEAYLAAGGREAWVAYSESRRVKWFDS
jgi:hypothetical protein